MNIGLVDVDGHNFPNFALMRISAYHKAQGDNVEWAMPLFGNYDRVYQSKIFTFTPDKADFDGRCEVVRGGTGYDVRSQLDPQMECITDMDYSLYPQYPFSIQFLSRGCIRQCPFCLVREKEGYIHPVEPVQLNPNGKHIEVLDNNFFANPEWKSAIDYLLAAKTRSKNVVQYDLEGNVVKEWPSATIAAKELNCAQSGINWCCLRKPKHNTYIGFIWRYVGDNDVVYKNGKAVVKCDTNGTPIQEYPNITTAAKDNGMLITSITNCLQGRSKVAGGFCWKLK